MKGFADFLAGLRRGRGERGRLAAVLELNRALAAVEGRGALLELLLDRAVDLFGAERGFLALVREEPPGWSIAVARSLDREPVLRPERKVSSTVLGRVIGEGAGLFSADAQAGDLAAAASIADLQLRSVLCVPLLRGTQVMGAVYLDHRFQGGAFSEADVPWLQAFADQAAIAIHLHGLLEEKRAHAEAVAARARELEQTVAAQARELSDVRPPRPRSELRGDYPHLLGRSPALLRSLDVLDRVAPGGFPVLLVGESGTGKELAARAVHRNGVRRTGPFVTVNVAAIPAGLHESELFGHVKGAFTGAHRDRLGLLREADGGVLFLDEVTEMPLDVQVKLLRFLEDGAVRPLGGDREERVRVRVVAATNREPRSAVRAGTFREDLYYRLAVVTVTLPPLRERLDDLPQLVDHFLAEAARARGGEPRRLDGATARALAARRWPGNLRQLRNEILRLDALATGGVIEAGMLEPEPRTAGRQDTLELAALERWAIDEAMRRSGGNKSEAARLLGVSRRTLYNKLGERG